MKTSKVCRKQNEETKIRRLCKIKNTKMKKQSFHNTILKAMLLKKQHYKKIIKYMKKQKYKNKKIVEKIKIQL